MKKKISTIFLDIDGTLSDNFHIHTKGWEAILVQMKKELNNSFFLGLHGVDTETAIKNIAEACQYPLSEADLSNFILIKNQVRDVEISKLSRRNLFPGLVQFLKSLKKNKVRIVCCSLSSACHVLLKQFEIDHFFADYICGKSVFPLKSQSSICYLNYIANNNLDQSECFVIDDDIDVLLNLRKSTTIRHLGVGYNASYLTYKIPFIFNYTKLLYHDLCNL